MFWDTLIRLDQEALLWLNRDAGAFCDMFFYIVSARLTWIPLYLAIVYVVWRRWGLRYMLWVLLFLGLSVIVADQICNFFKHFTPKFRPTHTPGIDVLVHTVRNYRGGLYGTVSAHAAASFTIALFTTRLFKNKWYSIAIFCWAILLAYSRIYLGVHYPMDILLGTLLGLFLGSIAYSLFRRIVPVPSQSSTHHDTL